MFRFLGSIIKLVTMLSTLMVAVEQIRKVMRQRKHDRDMGETSKAA